RVKVMSDAESTEKLQKSKCLFLSMSRIDILDPLSSVSFCAVLPTPPKVFGFVAKHPAADMYQCYLFQILQRENAELQMRLSASGDVSEEAVGLHTHTHSLVQLPLVWTHNSVPFKILFSLTSKPNPNPYFFPNLNPNPNLNPKP
uniref:PID domain-containing protein n=1 Tax=Salmo trutta TaxID=8032 RepID=A0A673ZD56_SALTR